MIFKLNKIGKKLYFLIIAILVIVFGATYFLNNFFLGRYYIYKTRENSNIIYNFTKTQGLDNLKNNINNLERDYNSTILIIPDNEVNFNNINSFNEELMLLLNKNKVNITKLWFSQGDINIIKSGDYVNKIFYQSKLQSNYFVKIFKSDNDIILVGISMANNQEVISITNKFTLALISLAIILSVFLVWIFTKDTVKSIENLKLQAKDISNLNFANTKIKTGDEIEELSESINEMSKKLEIAHIELNKKNDDLKILLSSMSHEMKTPLALIKAYAMGIKDGLDDGTFIDIILEKVDDTTELVTDLLLLSKTKRAVLNIEKVNLLSLIKSTLKSYEKLLDDKDIKVKLESSDAEFFIYADEKLMIMVVNNLIGNAIKYNDGNMIEIVLSNSDKKQIHIKNINRTITQNDIEKLFEPFFVVEESRSKNLSGTGVGLSIVSSILENHKFDYGVNLKNEIIDFYINIK